MPQAGLPSEMGSAACGDSNVPVHPVSEPPLGLSVEALVDIPKKPMRSSSAAMPPVDGNGRDDPVANMVSNKIDQIDVSVSVANFLRDPGTRAVQQVPAP